MRCKPHLVKSLERATLDLFLLNAGKSQAHCHVLENVHVGDKIVGLKNKTDTAVSISVPINVVVCLGGHTVDLDVAVGVAVKTAYNVEKRRLSAPGRAENRDEFVLSELY